MLNRIHIGGKVKIRLLRHEGKFQVFGETIQSMKNPQRCPPIKSGLLKKFSSMQAR